ncbi:hypothetical protein Anae109_2653 [Anaeromyxobacter sp. Fw109-5]|nr:hypothetical protein Anae109_2653 [Anaeromyxobacter sp. Fw109-5]
MAEASELDRGRRCDFSGGAAATGSRPPCPRPRLQVLRTQRLNIRHIDAIKDGDQVIGNRARVKVVKNKVVRCHG